jgi:hypothetical protein
MTNKSNDNSGATTIVGSFRGQFAPWGRWGRPKTASREVPFSEVLKIDEGRQILIVLCSQTQKGVARPCTEVLHDRRRRIFLQPSNQRRNRFCLCVYTFDFGLNLCRLSGTGFVDSSVSKPYMSSTGSEDQISRYQDQMWVFRHARSSPAGRVGFK